MDFFASLPQAIISRLRQAPCIVTEDYEWVLPAEAVICTDASAAARQLLAHATSAGVAGAKYVHQHLTVLLDSSALQSALGIKTLDVGRLLQVMHSAHAQGMLAALGMQWCAQMLACIFDMLAAQEPQLQSLCIQDMTQSSYVQSVCQQLRSLPIFPLGSGAWTAFGSDPDQPLFQAGSSLSRTAGFDATLSSESADQAQHKDAGQQLGAALDTCGLRVADMQLRMLAADFVLPDDNGASSLSKMLQVSFHTHRISVHHHMQSCHLLITNSCHGE